MTSDLHVKEQEDALELAEQNAFEAMRFGAAAECADDTDARDFLLSQRVERLCRAQDALNKGVTDGGDPFEIDSPEAVLSLTAGIRAGRI